MKRGNNVFELALFLFIMLVSLVARDAAAVPTLAVKGNRLINEDTGEIVILRGVNGPSALWPCIDGYGFWDAAVPTQQVMSALKEWNVNVVRTALNEDCWLGINGLNPKFSGLNYQRVIKDYVELLADNGIYTILELHWSAAGTNRSVQQQPMPDRGHAVKFWQSVAAAFMNNEKSSPIFDVFNEPFPDRNAVNSTAAWRCWRDGGFECPDLVQSGYMPVGMQGLVNAVRSTGARNIIMLGGINYANGMYMWLPYRPVDPLGNLVASWHSYSANACNNEECWNSVIKPLSEHVPVITGELGEMDCKATYILPLLAWLDREIQGSYLAWVYDHYSGCREAPALVLNASTGECTDSYGCSYKVWLQKHRAP